MVKCNRWKTSTMLNPPSRVQMDNIPYTNSIFLQIIKIMHSLMHAWKCFFYHIQFEILNVLFANDLSLKRVASGRSMEINPDGPDNWNSTIVHYHITSLETALRQRQCLFSYCFPGEQICLEFIENTSADLTLHSCKNEKEKMNRYYQQHSSRCWLITTWSHLLVAKHWKF